ncbi:MAG: hypothetical protein RLZZ628_1493 [Bacteroidota bacterium]|jgi:hypothetical protein
MTFKNISDLILNQNPEDKLFSERPFLRLSELPSRKKLNHGNLNQINLHPNEIWIGCENYSDTIPKNATFDVLFPYHAVEQPIYKKVILQHIYVKLAVESDWFPYGHTAICLLHFVEGIPKILDKLCPESQKFNYAKHDFFYLAQNSVYKKLQPFMETQE